MKRILLFPFILCFFSYAATAETFDTALKEAQLQILTQQEVKEQITQFPQNAFLTADFKETKTIPALSRPLISNGKLFLEEKKGMLLERISPFPMKTYLANGRIWQFVGNDNKPQEIEEPSAKMMAENLHADLSGQYDQLFDRFTSYGKT
jgi:hypothetical protein